MLRYHKLDRSSWPTKFEQMTWPMMNTVKTLSMKIAAYDGMIAKPAEEPEFREQVKRAQEIYGVGIVGSTVVVAAIDGDARPTAVASVSIAVPIVFVLICFPFLGWITNPLNNSAWL